LNSTETRTTLFQCRGKHLEGRITSENARETPNDP